jgi:cell division initiation protein
MTKSVFPESDNGPRHFGAGRIRELPRRAFGYDRTATDQLFGELAERYTHLWEERGWIEGRLSQAEADLADERRRQADASSASQKLKAALEKAQGKERELERRLQESAAKLGRSQEQERELAQRVQQLEEELQRLREHDAEVAARLKRSDAELSRFREQERSLAEALILAKQTAAELSETSKREAEQLVADAKRRAGEIVGAAERELERLAAERARLDALANEVQEDLSTFLLGTLERLKERPTEPSQARVAASDGKTSGDATNTDEQAPARAPRTSTKPPSRSRPAAG